MTELVDNFGAGVEFCGSIVISKQNIFLIKCSLVWATGLW